MRRTPRRFLPPALAAVVLLACLPVIPVRAETVDLDVMHRIRSEAFFHSRVMDYLHVIADRNGPRVTGSPGYRRAAEAAIAELEAAGIPNATLETWGTFGRGWEWTRVAVQMHAPQETTLTGIPADFSPGTDGPVRGTVAFAPVWPHESDRPEDENLIRVAEQLERWMAEHTGRLAGRIVMLEHPLAWMLPEQQDVFRFSDEDLADLAASNDDQPLAPGPYPKLTWPLIEFPVEREAASRVWDVMPLEFAADRWRMEAALRGRMFAFLVREGVAAVLIPGYESRAAVLFQSDFGTHEPAHASPPPTVALMPEHYNRLHRLIERGERVEVSVDVDATIFENQPGQNVIAELPGTGRRGELVMLGAHLDSWHGATGATDNASGSAVVLEVMRILKTLGVPLQRTVRAALWDGEEQCLCGSRGYVRNHFADPVSMALKPGHGKLSAYFNLDNGSGRVRGVYLQGNDMARPIFEAWLAPFAEYGVSTLTLTNTIGTDHLSFNAVGLPGFQFVQDPLDYNLNTHHSNVDDVGHISEGDLMQAAAVVATAVYHTAQREEMMPRKPLPAPLPPKGPLPDELRD
ncbi:MAG: M28 family peptidase [Pseudomonadales bacterium]